MILGISGYIGSGKDTVGKIIQFLVSPEYKDGWRNYTNWLESIYLPTFKSSWEIKKFATKLKEIASLMTGVPIEKWEDQEFKKTFMPSEWNYVGPSIESGDIVTCDLVTKQMTYREFLQKLGTEVGRQLNSNVWVNALFNDYKPSIYWMCDRCDKEDILKLLEIPSRFPEYPLNEFVCPHCKGAESEGDITQVIPSDYSKWIITDMRFLNEYTAVKNRGGVTIRVNREVEREHNFPGQPHISETALDNENFDVVIHNNGTLEELIEKVRGVLLHLNIIQ